MTLLNHDGDGGGGGQDDDYGNTGGKFNDYNDDERLVQKTVLS